MGKVTQKERVIIVRDVWVKIIKKAEIKIKKARKTLEQAEVMELKKEYIRIAAYKNLWKLLHKNSRPT